MESCRWPFQSSIDASFRWTIFQLSFSIHNFFDLRGIFHNSARNIHFYFDCENVD